MKIRIKAFKTETQANITLILTAQSGCWRCRVAYLTNETNDPLQYFKSLLGQIALML